jgi:hypothetical protein
MQAEMAHQLFEYRPSNAFRAPDWRWQVATYSARCGEKLPRRLTDYWIRLAAGILERSGYATAARHGNNWCQFWDAMGGNGTRLLGNIGMQQELEARILAGQADDEIAARMDMQAVEVLGYEQLLFAVREKLAAPGYIVLLALGPDVGDPIQRLGRLWKELAYWRGPLVLDYFVEAFRRLPRELQACGIRGYLHSKSNCPPLVRLNIEVRELGAKSATLAKRRRRLLSRLERIERRAMSGGSPVAGATCCDTRAPGADCV